MNSGVEDIIRKHVQDYTGVEVAMINHLLLRELEDLIEANQNLLKEIVEFKTLIAAQKYKIQCLEMVWRS